MKVVSVIALVLAVSVSTAVGNSCSGRKNGDQIPNTADCGSYYVCDYGTPSLFKCGGGLLYDHKLGVCNWASSVSCGQVVSSPTTAPATKPPTAPPTSPPATTPAPQLNPYPHWPVQTPDSTGDYYPGIQESKNSPLGFQCTIDGFYFAPHPSICEQYFICENRRIHFHQCGAGIHWDYIYLQCDFPERSYCYSNNTQNNNYNPPANLPVSGSPPVFIGVTAPVAIELPIFVENVTTTTPTTTEAPTTTQAPTTTEAPTTVTTAVTDDVPDESTIVCPADQAFMAHADCHKYYICISTLAISISCPDHMAWDDSIMQCTEEALSTCHIV